MKTVECIIEITMNLKKFMSANASAMWVKKNLPYQSLSTSKTKNQENETVSFVVEVAVIVLTLKLPTVDVDCVTPALKVAV